MVRLKVCLRGGSEIRFIKADLELPDARSFLVRAAAHKLFGVEAPTGDLSDVEIHVGSVLVDDVSLLEKDDELTFSFGGARAGAGNGDDVEINFDSENCPAVAALSRSPPPKAVRGTSGWVYTSKSFGVLAIDHPLRRLAIGLVEHPIVDPLILTTILCNLTTMAWASPLDTLDPSLAWKMQLLAWLEWVYLAVFTSELLAKVVACGLICHRHSYLRDPWNQVCCTVRTSKPFGLHNTLYVRDEADRSSQFAASLSTCTSPASPLTHLDFAHAARFPRRLTRVAAHSLPRGLR